MRRAELYEKIDKLDEALADYQKALEMDPSLHAARGACMVSDGRIPSAVTVAYFTKKVNINLAKLPLNSNGGLANLG